MMFYVCDIKEGLIGVRDTTDNTVEYHDYEELKELDKLGVGIIGLGSGVSELISNTGILLENVYTGEYIGNPRWDSLIVLPQEGYGNSTGSTNGCFLMRDSVWVGGLYDEISTFTFLSNERISDVIDTGDKLKFSISSSMEKEYDDLLSLKSKCAVLYTDEIGFRKQQLIKACNTKSEYTYHIIERIVNLGVDIQSPNASMYILRRFYVCSVNMLYFQIAYPVNENDKYSYRFSSTLSAIKTLALITKGRFANVVVDEDGFTYSGFDGTVHFSYSQLKSTYDRTVLREQRMKSLKMKLVNRGVTEVTANGVVTKLQSNDGILKIPDGGKIVALSDGGSIGCVDKVDVWQLIIPESFVRLDSFYVFYKTFTFDKILVLETHSRNFLGVLDMELRNSLADIWIDWNKSDSVSALCLLPVLYADAVDITASDSKLVIPYSQSLQLRYNKIFEDVNFRAILTPQVLDEMWNIYLGVYQSYDMLKQVKFSNRVVRLLSSIFHEVSKDAPISRIIATKEMNLVVTVPLNYYSSLTNLQYIYKLILQADWFGYVEYRSIIENRYNWLAEINDTFRGRVYENKG